MFVVFEGIDGSGKTTISNRVATQLRERGLSVKHLRAGGQFASLVTQAMRELGRDARHFELQPSAEFLLYLARDVQLLEQILRPALAEHDVVIADRSYFTAQVLGQYGRHLDAQWVNGILRSTTAQFDPNLVVLVDVDPKLARMRRKTAKLKSEDQRPPSRKGLAGVGLQYRLRAGYLALAAEQPERWVVLPNGGDLQTTIDEVSGLIAQLHGGQRGALQRFRETHAPSPSVAPALESSEQALAALLRWVDARMNSEPAVAAYAMPGLSGPQVDARRTVLAERAPEAVLAAMGGLDDDFSWQLRERLLPSLGPRVARTLGAFEATHARAQAMRERLLAVHPAEVLRSLSGSGDERVWQLRERLFEDHPLAVALSLSRVPGERAWALRERFRQMAPGFGEDYETSRIGLRSIMGLDDERAWEWRKLGRSAAPVAAVTSLKGLTSDKSWRWRERFLRWAPKTVMGTLNKLQHPTATTLRQRVASECKEALDSIRGLDDAGSWQLRDEHIDRWPSTVIKSLGLLADEARGKALLSRQLQRYPENISVLQHAAAIFLGAHRDDREEDD